VAKGRNRRRSGRLIAIASTCAVRGKETGVGKSEGVYGRRGGDREHRERLGRKKEATTKGGQHLYVWAHGLAERERDRW